MPFGDFLVLDKIPKEHNPGAGMGGSVGSRRAGIVPAVLLTRTGAHRTTLEGHEASPCTVATSRLAGTFKPPSQSRRPFPAGYFLTDRQIAKPKAEGGPISMSGPSIEGELVALLISAQVMDQYRGTPFEQDLRKALDKISKSLPDTIEVPLDVLTS